MSCMVTVAFAAAYRRTADPGVGIEEWFAVFTVHVTALPVRFSAP